MRLYSCKLRIRTESTRLKRTRTEACGSRLEENERGGDETVVLSSRDKRWAKSPTRKERDERESTCVCVYARDACKRHRGIGWSRLGART